MFFYIYKKPKASMKKLLTLLVFLSFNINAQVITIGTQTWTTKNLEVSTYRNGDTIPQVESESDWAKLSTGAWCYSEKDNGTVYGKLYNWYAVKDARGLAPNGFHIPSDAEWTILTDNLGGAEIAGSKMKSILGWHGSVKGINASGFSALPGGCRNYNGAFGYVGYYGYWWSSTEDNTFHAFYRHLSYDNGNAYRVFNDEHDGFSVRCLKD